MSKVAKELWDLVQTQQHLDPRDLTLAIEDQVIRQDLDYRSCVLIRDSVKALRNYWGPERLSAWLAGADYAAIAVLLAGAALMGLGLYRRRQASAANGADE